MATTVAACILVLLGIFRIGSWIKYIPHPLITGFTTAIAVVIFSTQIRDFFGLRMLTPPAAFTDKWLAYFKAFPTFDPLTLSMSLATLGVILLRRHRSNCELIAQGIANFGSIVFGGIPATGAIARTAANVKTGAQTPVAGMIHALVLLLILYCLAPLVKLIPLSALSAVLMMVAWNMSEVRHFARLFKAPLGDRVVLLAAFFLTIFVDITVAISVGMILASFLFMKRMGEMSKTVSLAFHEKEVDFPEKKDPDDISKKVVPKGVEVYEIQGPFFFGAANILRDLLSNVSGCKVFILRMRAVPMVDASGMRGIEEFYEQCKRQNITLLLSGVQGQTEKDLKKFGLTRKIGQKRIFPHIDAALEASQKLL